ncbi:hypothetical protein NFI96_028660 [Prochilodus magdalenae]|nr:hypothetical protein NFI96_028660 [Prochilodus magdalenae]
MKMKMSWMGLVLVLVLLMAVSSDAAQDRASLTVFSSSSAEGTSAHPANCCFQFRTFKIPESEITEIVKTHSNCPQPGYVVSCEAFYRPVFPDPHQSTQFTTGGLQSGDQENGRPPELTLKCRPKEEDVVKRGGSGGQSQQHKYETQTERDTVRASDACREDEDEDELDGFGPGAGPADGRLLRC